MKKFTGSTGRLTQILDPVAHAIVFPPKSETAFLKELNLLATLNEAHIITLSKAKLLSHSSAIKLLKLLSDLRKTKFSALLLQHNERGSYLLLESYLNEILGMKVAGSLHIGRSRNDINATIFKLNLRDTYKSIHNNLIDLRLAMLQQANIYMNLAMPVYSQYQVAQIGTYAYYLLAIEEALARDQHFIKELFISLDESPLGAASGCGTSFPINPALTANLLGFSRCCINALDAVANRDLALRVLSTLSVVGTTISRMAQDYQLWTTQEFAFFDLPDNLCGSSSMMPQKKNPYLLEVIKGKASSLNGLLVQALTSMHNVPFGNSFEVGTEALQGFDVALNNMCDILKLSNLLICNAMPVTTQLTKSIRQGVAIAANVAELLVIDAGLPFREVHFKIGEMISQAITHELDPTEEVYRLIGNELKAKETLYWAHINEYGGGPGKNITKKAYQGAKRRLKKDAAWLKSIEKQWKLAETKLQSEIKKLFN